MSLNQFRAAARAMATTFGQHKAEELVAARAIADAALTGYGDFDEAGWQRYRSEGIWNDHVAVQAALIAIRLFRTFDPLDELVDRAGPDPSRDKPPSHETRMILAAIEQVRNDMADQAVTTAQALADLKAAVAAEKSVLASATTAINGFPAVVSAAVAKALQDAGVDNAAAAQAAEDAANEITADLAPLQAALTANTPAPPASPPPPPPALQITPATVSGVVGEA